MRIDCDTDALPVNGSVSRNVALETISPERILTTAIEVVQGVRRDAKIRLECARSFSHSRVYREVMQGLGVEHLYRDDAGEPEQIIGVIRRITRGVITAGTTHEDNDSFNSGVAAMDLSRWV